MDADIASGPSAELPPDMVDRLVRAIDRSPSTIVVLLDRDLRIEWISQSVAWATGSDPEARLGSAAMERIHPDDIDRLLEGIGQLAAGSGNDVGATDPIRYRFQRADDTWVVMEATVHNLLDDPYVDGMLIFTRPVTASLTHPDHVLDLLVADMPLPEVLTACAELVPDQIGVAAMVALLDGRLVVGAPKGSDAERFAVDPRWWRPSVQRFESMWPPAFEGVADDLAEIARNAGYGTVWSMTVRDRVTGEMLGLLVVWVRDGVERNVAIDESLRRAERLAAMAIVEDRRRRSLDAWSQPPHRY